MARYSTPKLVDLLDERVDPDQMSRREMRNIAGQVFRMAADIQDALGLSDADVEEMADEAAGDEDAEEDDDDED